MKRRVPVPGTALNAAARLRRSPAASPWPVYWGTAARRAAADALSDAHLHPSVARSRGNAA